MRRNYDNRNRDNRIIDGTGMRIGVLTLLLCVFGVCAIFSPAQSSVESLDRGRIVRIGVFSLFRPTELRLFSAKGSSLVIEFGGNGVRSRTLPQDAQPVAIRASDSDGGIHAQIQVQFTPETARMRVVSMRVHAQAIAGEDGATQFWLEAPGKLRRQYTGTLEIRPNGQMLEAIVSMPLETATASVVEAESPPGAGIEALKAQAVAARSFLVAGRTSHKYFDFCDTTHCQFLRSPPVAGSPASAAARATEGLVLTWHDEASAQDRTLAAMYASSCGGRTRTLKEIGIPSTGYPYYAVHCVYCTHHPETWQRQLPSQSKAQTEQDRLAFDRIHGWGAIPSIPTNLKSYPGTPDNSQQGWVTGRGIGHGIGLCQLGAADMARHGSGFSEILAHYYPNTRITAMPEETDVH